MGELVQKIIPLGGSPRDEFCEELKKHAYHKGLLVLPNRTLVLDAQKKNVNAAVFDTLLNMILHLSPGRRYVEINNATQTFLMKHVLDDLMGQLPYFEQILQEGEKLSDKAGMAEALLRFNGERIRSSTTWESLKDYDEKHYPSDLKGGRGRGLKIIFDKYSEACIDGDTVYVDIDSKYLAAIDLLKEESVREALPFETVCFCDFYEYSPLQEKLINALAELPCTVYKAVPSFTGEEEPLKTDRVNLYSFVNREAEIRWTLAEAKRLLGTEKVSAEDIAIAVRSLSNYPDIRRIADEYGIPIRLPRTAKICSHPFIAFVFDLLVAAGNDGEAAAAYFRSIASPFGSLILSEVHPSVEQLPYDKYYSERKRAQQAIKKEFKDNTSIKFVDAQIEELETLGNSTVAGFNKVVLAIINSLDIEKKLGKLYRANKLDISELQNTLLVKAEFCRVLDVLQQDFLRGKVTAEIGLTKYIDTVKEYMDGRTLTLERGREDGIRVVNVVELQGSEYPYVFLLGMREGEFPVKGKESWLYNDVDREELRKVGVKLKTSREILAEDNVFFANAIAAATEELTLTWFRDEGVSDADGGASMFVQLLTSQLNKECQAMEYQGYSSVYEKNIVEIPVGSSEESAFKGLDNYKVGELWTKISSNEFSASALKAYQSCPLKYLADKVWKVSKRKLRDETPDSGDKGTFVHNVLERFIAQKIIPAGRSFDSYTDEEYAALGKSLFEIFNQVAEQMEQDGSFAGPFWTVEKENLKDMVRRWFAFEREGSEGYSGSVPIATEWNFGSKSGNVFSMTIPLDGEEGSSEERVRFSGRIDRMDIRGDELIVYDYKSGEAPNKDDFQIPIYLLALRNILREAEGKKVKGSYVELKKLPVRKSEMDENSLEEIPKKKKNNENKNTEENTCENIQKPKSIKEKIFDALRGIRAGNYIITNNGGQCSYCPLREGCEKGRKEGRPYVQ